MDNPELAESNSAFIFWAFRVAPVVAELLDHFFRLEFVLWTCHSLACTVVRVLEASDLALHLANVLKIMKAEFNSFRYLVVEAEVVVGLNDREILFAIR
jgi:hypothetical protein